jgi:hypothetical protein
MHGVPFLVWMARCLRGCDVMRFLMRWCGNRWRACASTPTGPSSPPGATTFVRCLPVVCAVACPGLYASNAFSSLLKIDCMSCAQGPWSLFVFTPSPSPSPTRYLPLSFALSLPLSSPLFRPLPPPIFSPSPSPSPCQACETQLEGSVRWSLRGYHTLLFRGSFVSCTQTTST